MHSLEYESACLWIYLLYTVHTLIRRLSPLLNRVGQFQVPSTLYRTPSTLYCLDWKVAITPELTGFTFGEQLDDELQK